MFLVESGQETTLVHLQAACPNATPPSAGLPSGTPKKYRIYIGILFLQNIGFLQEFYGKKLVFFVVAGLATKPEHINYGKQLINIIEITEYRIEEMILNLLLNKVIISPGWRNL